MVEKIYVTYNQVCSNCRMCEYAPPHCAYAYATLLMYHMCGLGCQRQIRMYSVS